MPDSLPDWYTNSDRGFQYCSNQYVDELKKRDIKISMTEENHCYENAIAERVNEILKDEFYLDQTFFSKRAQVWQLTTRFLFTTIKDYIYL